MRISFLHIVLFSLCLSSLLFAGTKNKGEKCFGNAECAFGLECNNNICTKQKAFDFGSSKKTGKPCNVDADCIGSGKCVKNSFGKSYCSGN